MTAVPEHIPGRRVTVAVIAALLASSDSCCQEVTEDLKLIAEFDVLTVSGFGDSVSLHDGLLVVGASTSFIGGAFGGSSFVFDIESGQQVRRLLPGPTQVAGFFGTSVLVDGDRTVVGAPLYDGQATDSGALFVYDNTTGTQLTTLTVPGTFGSIHLGNALAQHGSQYVVGANYDQVNGAYSGSAHLYDWNKVFPVQSFYPDDGGVNDFFGDDVTSNGNMIFVGAPGDDDIGRSVGAVYQFDPTSGSQEFKYKPDGSVEFAGFGGALSADGDLLVIGAPAQGSAGLVYVFDVASRELVMVLAPDDGHVDDEFGCAVHLDGDIVVVGARSYDAFGLQRGAAYVFNARTGQQLQKLVASDGQQSDRFGSSVVIEDELIVVGSPFEDNVRLDAGAVYMFDLSCVADVNRDYQLTPADFTAWINAFNHDLPGCDQNGDSACNPADFTAWIANFNAGCP
ncbi:MAG: hypothetical protein F6K11_18820 [Leptolyngbya sp. SIO3F4]|nr:hypothetical protein [Leptolyngbya sp. SIO3F4]